MGKKAKEFRRVTRRKMRATPLTDGEKEFLHKNAEYEGSPYHKKSPGDFGLTPPASPRPDKTLCDEANVTSREAASSLLKKAIKRGLVSESEAAPGFPKHFWVVDGNGQVFEAIYGGSKTGSYHGYPIRRTDPFFDEVVRAWQKEDQ